jgi:PAS domain S-box-containing protein
MLARDLRFSDFVRFDPDQGKIDFCGRRAVLVQADAMGALRKELVDTLGVEIAKVILSRYGYSCGWGDARDLAPHMAAQDDAEYVLAGPRLHGFEGVVLVRTTHLKVDHEGGHHEMAGTWAGSYEAEQHLRLFGPSAEPACWTVAGYASGYSSRVFNTPMICIEDRCVARGDPECSWRLVPAAEAKDERYRRLFMPLNLQAQINLLEQKVAERTSALTASESRYRDLVDNLSEVVFSLDPDGRLVHVNRAGLDRLGIRPSGKAVMLSRLMTRPHRHRVARFLRQVGESRQEGRLEVELCSAQGEEFPVQLQISPVIDGDVLAGFRGLALDISTTQARERQLAEYALSLESQLAQATRLAGLGQFASGLAHEINNPMGLISGYAEELLDLLSELPESAEAAKLRRGLATIQEQAYRCKYITQNVLSFARDQTVNLELTDLGQLVREKTAFFAGRADAKDLEISLSIAANLPPLLTDPILCGQILLNILKNAADAQGGRGKIKVSLTRYRERLRLEVADDGPGLPRDIMHKVFDPFFTTKDPNRGTGLGLSICYGIARSLGGSITCGNRPKGGAWFRVSLPMLPPSRSRKTTSSKEAAQ